MAGDPGSSNMHSEIMNLGRPEIGYNSKGQVINRVDKSQILVLNRVSP